MRDFLSADRELEDLLNRKQLYDEAWTPGCKVREIQGENSIKRIEGVKNIHINSFGLTLSKTHLYLKESS